VTTATDERGLLGLASHPQYAQNGRFFVVYNAPVRPIDPAGFDDIWRLSEFHVSANDPNRADAASEAVLLEILKPQGNHNGGQLAFGPDGMLYASIGDGGQASDVGPNHTPGIGNAQDLTNLLGSLLRFNADTPGTLTVPPDNPFTADPSVLPQIFAYGLRNPWRFSFDMGGSRRLFCADAGQSLFEEVSIVQSGDNLGWNIKEGRHCFDPDTPADPPATCPNVGANGRPLIDPVIEYAHRDASGQQAYLAVVGGYVYRGSAVPDLAGRYVFGDWSRLPNTPDGTILVAEEDAAGAWQFNELPIATSANGRLNRYVLAFGQDLEGELYVLSSQSFGPAGATGQVFKIVRAP
jgi:glucose/arabinose dehydrogenase